MANRTLHLVGKNAPTGSDVHVPSGKWKRSKKENEDLDLGRAALARVSKHGTDEEKAAVRAEVYRKFPELKSVEKAAAHSGVMVALMIPPEVANGLFVPGGEPEEELHVTVAYVPGIADDEESIVALQEALSPLAQTLGPISGSIGGTGRFLGSDSSGGKDVFYASFNSPGLEALRRAVCHSIEQAGLDMSRKHGFTPHITLKYLDPSEPTPDMRITAPPFEIRKLTIGMNDEYTDFEMIGTIILKGIADEVDDLHLMAEIVSGTDWELSDGGAGLKDADEAKAKALENLSDDHEFYRKKRVALAGGDESGVGLNLDLGSGQAREPGYLGIDLYPFDHGTIVHDLDLGLSFIGDETVKNVRMSNVPDVEPGLLMNEVQRVLMPDGQFIYEGPSEIFGLPPYMEQLGKEEVEKAAGKWTKQTFRKVAIPDAATSDDADPRFGVAQYGQMPADAVLAIDATSYYDADGTTSGPGNRKHGYPSQGAALAKNLPFDLPKRRDLGTDNTGAISKVSPIFKADKYKQIIYCVVLAPDETDLQDDIMTAEEIEKTAHAYLIDYRVVGAQHSRPMDASVVESYISPQDFNADGQYGPQLVKKGSWVIGIKVEDPREWQKVLNGEYTGVSVGGLGSRIPV